MVARYLEAGVRKVDWGKNLWYEPFITTPNGEWKAGNWVFLEQEMFPCKEEETDPDFQLICSGLGPTVKTPDMKDMKETEEMYKNYCEVVTSKIGGDKGWCGTVPLEKANLEEDDEVKDWVHQSECLKHRKCIAGFGDRWSTDSHVDCVDTVSPCYWTQLNPRATRCQTGLSYAQRSARSNDPITRTFEKVAENQALMDTYKKSQIAWNERVWAYNVAVAAAAKNPGTIKLAEDYLWAQTFEKNKLSYPRGVGDEDPEPEQPSRILTGDGRSGSKDWMVGIHDEYMTHFKNCWGFTKSISAPSESTRRRLLESEEHEGEGQVSLEKLQLRRRDLLGSKPKKDFEAVGSVLEKGTKMAIDAAVDTATEGIEAIADGANDLAQNAEDIANAAADKVEDIANQAADGITGLANKAADMAKGLADMPGKLWDQIYDQIPTSFKLNTASIQDLAFGGEDEFNCDTNLCKQTELKNATQMEATVCNIEKHCEGGGKSCFTPDADICPQLQGKEGSDELDNRDWAMACDCESFRDPITKKSIPFHCNFASGFCQAGASPFKPPLGKCETQGELAFGQLGYNRLCYISPLWKCANKDSVDECRKEMGWQLQGPSLCRSFCEPTFENRNNRLTQYEYSDDNDSTKCVCEVGVDRAYPDAPAGTSSSEAVKVYSQNPNKRKRRSLMEEGIKNKSPYSLCTTSSQCTPTWADLTLCKSIWDTIVPCYACSERIHGNGAAGIECSSETNTCECTAPTNLDDGDESSRPDEAEWRGTSWCDNLMRAYKHAAIRTPLENAWVP
jgi:hypothetical protein